MNELTNHDKQEISYDEWVTETRHWALTAETSQLFELMGQEYRKSYFSGSFVQELLEERLREEENQKNDLEWREHMREWSKSASKNQLFELMQGQYKKSIEKGAYIQSLIEEKMGLTESRGLEEDEFARRERQQSRLWQSDDNE